MVRKFPVLKLLRSKLMISPKQRLMKLRPKKLTLRSKLMIPTRPRLMKLKLKKKTPRPRKLRLTPKQKRFPPASLKLKSLKK